MTLAEGGRAMNRCSGHCCKNFVLNRDGFLAVPRDEVLLELGYGVASGAFEPSLKPLIGFLDLWPDDDQETARFSCRHLSASGDCSIYEDRPQMCRRYPTDEACRFEGCTLEPANALRFVA